MKFKSLPPGVPFIFRLLLILATPPSVVYLAYRIANSRDTPLPSWLWIAAVILSGPLALTVRVWSKYRSYRRRAARMGAVLPPALEGREPGNFDILRGILDAFLTGYPCERTRHDFKRRSYAHL